MKKLLSVLSAVALILSATVALAELLPVRTYANACEKTLLTYESDSLVYTIEQVAYADARCFVTKVWMRDPGSQIRKATAHWEKDIMYPSDMAKKLDGAMLCVNGSGYVSPVFPGIPDNYPGKSADYFYTPLGSLTITDGEIFRNLMGVPYYGLTLQSDGLHMHVGDDIPDVLSDSPTQTWSFYVNCPLIRDGQSILDEEWDFAKAKAIRTIIAKVDDNNYVLLTVTAKVNAGMSLINAVAFLQQTFAPEWAYNLDGGPSSALLARTSTEKKLRTIYGNNSKDADVMAFVELP